MLIENKVDDKVEDMHLFFTVIGRDIKEVTNNCSSEDLHCFVAESYIIYSTLKAEALMRAAFHDLQYKHQELYGENPWTKIEH